jgi:LEA14-like dessication related protein
MPKAIVRYFIFSICLLAAAGCAGLGMQQQPRVSLVDIRIQEMRPLETVFLIYLRVLNPGETTLTIRGIDCDLIVNGYNFATGLSGSTYRIGPYESVLAPVTVYASNLEMVSSIAELLRRAEHGRTPAEALRYELRGNVRTGGTGWSAGRIPFTSRGELILPGSR